MVEQVLEGGRDRRKLALLSKVILEVFGPQTIVDQVLIDAFVARAVVGQIPVEAGCPQRSVG